MVIPILLVQASFVPAVQADTIAYIGYQNGAFGTVDLDTGVLDPINPGIGTNPAGFGSVSGKLFTASYSGGDLYTVNTTTGALSLVGHSAGTSYHDFGSTPTNLVEADANQKLYSVDPSNGSTALLGSITGVTFSSYRALSTNSSTLYYASDNTLYSLASNGAATAVGSFTGSGSVVMTAMMMANGTLYGADQSGNFYTINTATGAAVLDASIPNVGGAVWALAPIPEPDTYAMILAGLGMAILSTRRCRRRPGR